MRHEKIGTKDPTEIDRYLTAMEPLLDNSEATGHSRKRVFLGRLRDTVQRPSGGSGW